MISSKKGSMKCVIIVTKRADTTCLSVVNGTPPDHIGLKISGKLKTKLLHLDNRKLKKLVKLFKMLLTRFIHYNCTFPSA